jgi:hypothetical protein
MAYRGKKAFIAPQVKREKELMMDGGRAIRLIKDLSSIEESCNGETCLLSSLYAINSEHNDKPEANQEEEGEAKVVDEEYCDGRS